MEPFPGERANQQAISKTLAAQFDLAERVYQYWLRKHEALLSGATLAEHVRVVALLLNVQACRLFRSVVEECERGEGFSANMLARGLYETLLAIRFALSRRLRIILSAKNGQYRAVLPSKANRGSRQDSLSREQRAWIYTLHTEFEHDRLIAKCAATPGLKRVFRMKRLRRDAAMQKIRADLEKAVGPKWCNVLQNRPWTYSGLSVANLAKLVDRSGRLSQWYLGPYDIQSGLGHAAAAHRHTKLLEDGRFEVAFVSSEQEIAGTLQAGTAILLACMVTLKQELGLGQSLGMVLDAFTRDFHRVFASTT